MKIDEFTNNLSGVVNFTCDSKIIRIYADDWAFHHDNAFLVLDAKANNLINFEDWGECDRLSFDRLHETLNLVQKLRDTPVSERFPEKKYVLSAMRYVEGPIAIKQYVTAHQFSGDYVTFDFGSKKNASEYTDEELYSMSQWFPREAIEAMKEPAEDSEDED